jgi:hypothetical protein
MSLLFDLWKIDSREKLRNAELLHDLVELGDCRRGDHRKHHTGTGVLLVWLARQRRATRPNHRWPSGWYHKDPAKESKW